MTKNILILQGHPQAQARHFGHALADAYAKGAALGGHSTQIIEMATLDWPLLRSKAQWESGELPRALAPVQEALRWSDHLVLLFPLWLGGMPAFTKGFLEQLLRPGFAFGTQAKGAMPAKLLKGRSARVVVTMGMPALVYRWYFRAHSVKALERNILGFVGFAPVRETLIGMVEGKDGAARDKWLRNLQMLGRKGD